MRPFTIDIPQEQLDDLIRRLCHARLAGAIFQPGAEDGTSLPFMRKLLAYWIDGFDWRLQEARLNRLPQFTTEVQGSTIHYVHRKGVGPATVPLVLTHGWSGSFIEFEALVDHLADPQRFARAYTHLIELNQYLIRRRTMRNQERTVGIAMLKWI